MNMEKVKILLKKTLKLKKIKCSFAVVIILTSDVINGSWQTMRKCSYYIPDREMECLKEKVK